eukprot:scaffold152373_cov17-Tisochrysis_lutea.AAC.2
MAITSKDTQLLLVSSKPTLLFMRSPICDYTCLFALSCACKRVHGKAYTRMSAWAPCAGLGAYCVHTHSGLGGRQLPQAVQATQGHVFQLKGP